jgi:hypothetical protein
LYKELEKPQIRRYSLYKLEEQPMWSCGIVVE